MPNDKPTLNDIIKNFQHIEMMLIESGGELSETIESLLINNESELSEKLDGYEKFVRYLKGQVEYLKSAEEQYSNRRKIIDNSILRCKERMLNALLITCAIRDLKFCLRLGMQIIRLLLLFSFSIFICL